ncbi:hypothetical protein Dsin_025315 [Dipteronia sinensis]|uniref:Reverse transcriptase domain-containing protein n=1 Tax=Dipteronia sinensis TaxID=43782 RepID=A0AAD9ZVW6_9ROSI|nr:hypothetical protein Dsin_025315 [Dipteronia sinensis]
MEDGKEQGLLVKLNFEKVYDSLDHGFLDFMMVDMCFGSKWRSCIMSPMLLVLVNGSTTLLFGVERGLHQGDPLSPFLFNIVVEEWNCLFQKAYDENLIECVALGDICYKSLTFDSWMI